MRIVMGLMAVLLMTSLSAKADEAFVAQVANSKTSAADAKSLTGGALISAMLASPLPLSALNPAAQADSSGRIGNVSDVAQSGANNFVAVAQTGAANQSAVIQHGTGNTALVTQRGGTR